MQYNKALLATVIAMPLFLMACDRSEQSPTAANPSQERRAMTPDSTIDKSPPAAGTSSSPSSDLSTNPSSSSSSSSVPSSSSPSSSNSTYSSPSSSNSGNNSPGSSGSSGTSGSSSGDSNRTGR